MRSTYLLALLLGGLMLGGSAIVRATSELEVWCLAQGQSWSANTCTIEEAATATIGTTLTIIGGELLDNHGQLTISDLGTVECHGDIDNDGTIDSAGTITVHEGAAAYNYGNGVFNNQATFDVRQGGGLTNASTFNNYGNVQSHDYVANFGTLNNHGTFINGSYFYNSQGDLVNHTGSQFHNAIDGTVENTSDGLVDIRLGGSLYNHGTILNSGDFRNDGTVYRDLCVASIMPEPTSGAGAVVDIEICPVMLLPVVVK